METEELKFALGIPSEAALRRLGFAEEELAETVQFWGTLTPSYHKYMRIFPGIRETLTALKEKGIRLGIVTSRNRPEYEKDFLPFGLEPFLIPSSVRMTPSATSRTANLSGNICAGRRHSRKKRYILVIRPMIWHAPPTQAWKARWRCGAALRPSISEQIFILRIPEKSHPYLCGRKIPERTADG